jgi:DNA-binding CsgD family transcriptional regulator
MAEPHENAPLTLREMEVSALVAEGLTNMEIAVRLNLSRRTVENHLQSAYYKTGVNNRVRLLNWLASHSSAQS